MKDNSVSTESRQRTRIFRKALRDIEFICRQILRFSKMSPEQLLKHMAKRKEDAFCTIPHHSGQGHLICGHEASQRFDTLGNLVLDYEPYLAGRVNSEIIREKIVDAFVQRVLREHGGLDTATAETILKDASDRCKESLGTREYFLPCVLFNHGGPNEFRVGPVTFARRATFFRSRRAMLKESVQAGIRSHIAHVNRAVMDGFPCDRAATEEQSRQFVRSLHARALKTFRNYPWVARASVSNCGYETGTEIAERTITLAINSMRVILGASHTSGLRLAWFPVNPRQTAQMWTNSEGMVQVSIGSKADGPVGVKNWYDGLTISNGSELAILGSALEPLVTCAPVFHLQQRLLDAINWFGDAAADPEPTASIVKYVSAIERLLFGARQRETRKQFGSRLKALWVGFDCDGKETVGDRAHKVYEARSCLLHGSMSPRSTDIHHLVTQSGEIARLCILCAGQLYPMMIRAYGDPGPDMLEKVMMKIQGEGIDWLAKEAGYLSCEREGIPARDVPAFSSTPNIE